MDSKEVYEIDRTADFIHNKNFTKVALQVKNSYACVVLFFIYM